MPSQNNKTERACRASEGLTTLPPFDINILIPVIAGTYCLKRETIKEYFDTGNETSSRLCFRLMMVIADSSERMCLRNLVDKLGCNKRSAELALRYMVAHELLREIGKPRFIVPLQRWKIDRAYKLTGKGLAAMQGIIRDMLGIDKGNV